MKAIALFYTLSAAVFAGPFVVLDWSGDGKVDQWVWDLVLECIGLAIFFAVGEYAAGSKDETHNTGDWG